MMYARLLPACLLAASLGALQGCRVGIEDLQPPLQEKLDRMESRLLALEIKPRLDFSVRNEQILIEEKTFTPLLVAQAELDVQGDNLPPAFYVDVMLSVTVDGIAYEAAERQVFPVLNGKCQVAMQHSLPQHGLTREQMKVTLRPMTWYRGQVISDEMVTYQ
jgi:hypothetical protein